MMVVKPTVIKVKKMVITIMNGILNTGYFFKPKPLDHVILDGVVK